MNLYIYLPTYLTSFKKVYVIMIWSNPEIEAGLTTIRQLNPENIETTE